MSNEIPENEIGMVECCPDCGNENWYRSAEPTWKVCSECGKVHKPCSLCDPAKCDCKNCPLGEDREVWVMESNTNGGMIDFGCQFGLDEYIKGADRMASANGLEPLDDDSLVYGWLEDCHTMTEGGYYVITDGKDRYRVYKGCRDEHYTIDYHGKPMEIDLDDTLVKPSFVVLKDF